MVRSALSFRDTPSRHDAGENLLSRRKNEDTIQDRYSLSVHRLSSPLTVKPLCVINKQEFAVNRVTPKFL
jgi:hypothetical protein